MNNHKSPILSFIVPIYNVAPYLRKCVDSLLAQDYDDYEIILVDDGSTDDSAAICDEFAATSFASFHHSIIPIRVIHQPNAGLSAARNTGIAEAKGKYICFVDSDDFWQPNVLGALMAQMEREQLDVLRFDYQNVRVVDAKHLDVARLDSANLAYKVFEPNKTPRYIDKCTDIVDGQTYLNTRMDYACYAWQFVTNRELTGTFMHGTHFEDAEWMPRMMLQAKRVNSTSTTVYNYLIRQGSITQTQGHKDKLRKNINDHLVVIESLLRLEQTYPDCQWLRRMRSTMALGVLTSVARNFYSERCDYIHRLRELHVFPPTIDNQNQTYKRRAWLLNLVGVYVYCDVMHLIRK